MFSYSKLTVYDLPFTIFTFCIEKTGARLYKLNFTLCSETKINI